MLYEIDINKFKVNLPKRSYNLSRVVVSACEGYELYSLLHSLIKKSSHKYPQAIIKITPLMA